MGGGSPEIVGNQELIVDDVLTTVMLVGLSLVSEGYNFRQNPECGNSEQKEDAVDYQGCITTKKSFIKLESGK